MVVILSFQSRFYAAVLPLQSPAFDDTHGIGSVELGRGRGGCGRSETFDRSGMRRDGAQASQWLPLFGRGYIPGF